MFRWNDMYIYNTRIVGETNSKQTLKRRRAHTTDRSNRSRDRIGRRIEECALQSLIASSGARFEATDRSANVCIHIHTYIYMYTPEKRGLGGRRLAAYVRTYVYSVVQFRLRPTAMTSMGCHASLLLFCRILMEARLINELVVEGTRKDTKGGGISPPSFFLDSPRSVAIASGFFKGKSPVVGCLRFCPNCFFFFFFDKLQASFLR